MADNFSTNAASGGATFASDDIAGVHYPYVKLAFGGADAATIVAAGAGLPVAQQTGASFTVVGAAADGAALAGNPVLIGGSDGTNAQSISVTTGGHIHIHDGGNSITVDGTVAATQSGAWNVTNAGTFAVQVDGAALTALQLIDNPVLVDDAAFTPGTSSVMMAGFQADEASTDSVNEGDAGAARMTLDRKVIVTPQPHTAGGLSIFRSIDLDETEEEVKGSAGQLYSITAFNRTAAPLYLKVYDNTAAGTVVGTTTPIATFVVPANADSDGAGYVWQSPYGVACTTGITVACTTGVADADTGAPGANDCVCVITYL